MPKRRCVPCEGGVAKMTDSEVEKALGRAPKWVLSGNRLVRDLKFADFKALMLFTNRVAELAEREGHHPDFEIHYNKLKLTLWTHAVGGLTENDFVMAEEIDALT